MEARLKNGLRGIPYGKTLLKKTHLMARSEELKLGNPRSSAAKKV